MGGKVPGRQAFPKNGDFACPVTSKRAYACEPASETPWIRSTKWQWQRYAVRCADGQLSGQCGR